MVLQDGVDLISSVVIVAPEHRAALVAAGVLPPLIACLGHKNRCLSHTSATALAALCHGERPVIDLAMEAGLWEPLFAILKTCSKGGWYEPMEAMGRIMSSASKEHRDWALACGAARHLVACLSSTKDSVAAAAAIALGALLEADEHDDEGRPYKASLVGQILEGVSASRLVALSGSEAFKRGWTAHLLNYNIADIGNSHRELIKAGLCRVLVAMLPESFPIRGADDRLSPLVEAALEESGPDFDAPPSGEEAPFVAYLTLVKLIRGPEAAEAANAVLAAGGLRFLDPALSVSGEAGRTAAKVLLEASKGAAQGAALLAADAVPRAT